VLFRRTRCATVASAAAVLLLTGCGSLDADGVHDAAEGFAAAGNDAAARCALLARQTLSSLEKDESAPCQDAIQDMPVGTGDLRSVEVWGEEAQAKLEDDTLFLTRTPDGWRISAAGCTPQGPERPYHCQVEAS
jgi:hypothetical protein